MEQIARRGIYYDLKESYFQTFEESEDGEFFHFMNFRRRQFLFKLWTDRSVGATDKYIEKVKQLFINSVNLRVFQKLMQVINLRPLNYTQKESLQTVMGERQTLLPELWVGH